MLNEAATRAIPTKTAQNMCPGIHDGTPFTTSCRNTKCCMPKNASGHAKNNGPNEITLSSPWVRNAPFLNVRKAPNRNNARAKQCSQNELPVYQEAPVHTPRFVAVKLMESKVGPRRIANFRHASNVSLPE